MSNKLHPAEQYAADVREGKATVCELVKLAVERYYSDLAVALDRGWHFDRKAAGRAIRFIESLRHTKGEWA
jgi:phage terminase large subunit-like protein